MTDTGSGAVPIIGWVTIDSQNPQALAYWWKDLLGGALRVDEDGDVFLESGAVPLLFMRNDDPKVVKDRVHLDPQAADYDAAVARAVALGAVPADDVHRGDAWRVLRDPEGHEFCIIRPKSGG